MSKDLVRAPSLRESEVVSAEMERPYRFFVGPWENSLQPTICKDDPEGGDYHILAVLTRIHRPEEIDRLVRLANAASQFDVRIAEAAEGPKTDNVIMLLEELNDLEDLLRWHGGRAWAKYAPLIRRASTLIAQGNRKDGSPPKSPQGREGR